ncbi:MAG: FtsX-like permease family protein [Puia sp.]|nr:FtsX-like permease family protein [Puia sp.]
MNFLFAWRYFKAKKSTNAINVIAWVSVAAIIVGSASLVLVLSVFNGFEDLVKSLYKTFYSDLKVTATEGKSITLSDQQLRQLAGLDGIRAFSRIAEDNAWMQNGQTPSPIFLKGVDSSYTRVSSIDRKLIRGKFELGTGDHPSAILGYGIENALGILYSDRSVIPLSVYLFNKSSLANPTDPMASVSADNIVASGTFAIQDEFDYKYVITNLAFVKRMLGFAPDEYSALEIALVDSSQAETVKANVKRLLGGDYHVQTRYEQNQGLYGVMRTEKWVIYIVLSLILVVAAFNMVGALTMLVLEKQKDIHVLKALGADNGYIQRIFLSEGLLLAFLGGGIGIGLAVIICWLQLKYKLVPLQGGSFLVDYYPVKLVPLDFGMVLGTVLVVALLASWFPSRKAAREPIDLR